MKEQTKTKRRTPIDWSRHELTITKNDLMMIHQFKRPDSGFYMVKFINTQGVLLVVGDLGNWVFCREYHPSPKGEVSAHYWIEKLESSSRQKAKQYDPDATEKELRRLLDGGMESDGYGEGEDLDDLREFYGNVLDHVDNEFEYNWALYEYKTSEIDSDWIVKEERIDSQLLAVFDAFEEICERLKEQEQQPVSA